MPIRISSGLLSSTALNGYTDAGHAAKLKFHREGKQFLRLLAAELDLSASTKPFSISSNRGGVAVSGEVTLHSDDLYVQLHESCVGRQGVSVLFRSCSSRKDFCGNRNHTVRMENIQTEAAQASFIANLKDLINAERARKESLLVEAA
jgi:hypothetical protein